MAFKNLPDELKPAISQFASLSDESFDELSTLLERAPLSFSDDDLTESITAKAKTIPSDAVASIVEMLTVFHWIRTSVGVSIDEFVGDVAKAIAESDLKESVAAVPQFNPRLSQLLGIKSVAFAAKAREIQRNHEKSFCDAEILTDIRPMFGSNGEGSPMAAVLIHTLKISYHQRNKLKDLFVALTADDLDTLEDVIEKARDESEQLGTVLDAANLSYPKAAE